MPSANLECPAAAELKMSSSGFFLAIDRLLPRPSFEKTDHAGTICSIDLLFPDVKPPFSLYCHPQTFRFMVTGKTGIRCMSQTIFPQGEYGFKVRKTIRRSSFFL